MRCLKKTKTNLYINKYITILVKYLIYSRVRRVNENLKSILQFNIYDLHEKSNEFFYLLRFKSLTDYTYNVALTHYVMFH